jgi:GWxTD domain-containing protein
MCRWLPRPSGAPFLLCACVLLLPAAQAQQQKPRLHGPVPARVLKLDGGVSLYKAWLEEDVRWIITDEERSAFRRLTDDEERDQFIDEFWFRRDPTPRTIENEFRDEHYRRIAFANKYFGAHGIPGWKTDRGRFYIVFGPPDEIESHPELKRRLPHVGDADAFPYDVWRYDYIEGLGKEIEQEFVDTCLCGNYRLAIHPATSDDPVPQPWTRWYWGLLADKESAAFEGSGLGNPPAVRFKDLEVLVSHRIDIRLLPFDVRADFTKVTNATTLVPVTIQLRNRDFAFLKKDGAGESAVNIFGRVIASTGRVVETFEDTLQVDVPNGSLPRSPDSTPLSQKTLPLRPGSYRLDIAVKDVNGDRVGTWSHGLAVP